MGSSTSGKATQGYFESRYAAHPRRQRVWRYLCAYLNRGWIPEVSRILDLGAGYCDFINQIRARDKWAWDVHWDVARYAAPEVRLIIGDYTNLSSLADGSLDVVFASNVFEHFSREDLCTMLLYIRRALADNGRLIVMQPNFKYCMAEYFDDYTHISVFTHVSLTDLLQAEGFTVLKCEKRFFPFSFKSRLSSLSALVPLYLLSPFRPFAKQMLIIAQKTPRQASENTVGPIRGGAQRRSENHNELGRKINLTDQN